MSRPPRIAVVSPFLDKRHGTERVLAEQAERLSQCFGWDVHIYSQRVDGFSSLGSVAKPLAGSLTWRRISAIRGPHLFQYIWWLSANQLRRWRDQRSDESRFDLIYSAGINCLDADAVAVHVVFRALRAELQYELKLRGAALSSWPRVLHRRLYYSLIIALENRVYRDARVRLATVSQRTARDLQRLFGRNDVTVIPNAVDTREFAPRSRESQRSAARGRFSYAERDFVLLLIGNGWKNKGLDTLLEASALCANPDIKVLIIGSDDRSPYLRVAENLRMELRVRFEEPSGNVLQFYAAADVYVSPSLYDSFALPPLEAMACGLPVIVSREAGVSELVSHGVDGFILQNPRDAAALAQQILRLHENADLRRRIGENAARTAQQYSWERNAAATKAFLEEAIRLKQERRAARSKLKN
jgi:glycosyltransferase involved in cell wall biosynthesis